MNSALGTKEDFLVSPSNLAQPINTPQTLERTSPSQTPERHLPSCRPRTLIHSCDVCCFVSHSAPNFSLPIGVCARVFFQITLTAASKP
jgi:hypothetical protein